MLTASQHQRNPTEQERRIMTSLAGGASRREAALAAGLSLRQLTAQVEGLRDRFAPTTIALIALAVKLEWVALPVWMAKGDRDGDRPPPPSPKIVRRTTA